MSFKEYQKRVDDWAQQFKKPYFEPLELVARLAEEVGEVARETNHLYGPKKKKDLEGIAHLGEELADVVFTVIAYANREGLDMDEYMETIMKKCYERDNDRYEKK